MERLPVLHLRRRVLANRNRGAVAGQKQYRHLQLTEFVDDGLRVTVSTKLFAGALKIPIP